VENVMPKSLYWITANTAVGSALRLDRAVANGCKTIWTVSGAQEWT